MCLNNIAYASMNNFISGGSCDIVVTRNTLDRRQQIALAISTNLLSVSSAISASGKGRCLRVQFLWLCVTLPATSKHLPHVDSWRNCG